MKQYYLQQILSTIFYLSNKAQSEGDKLDDFITVKQWMALLTIMHLPKNKANYNQIASMMGYSKQNAKKLVAALERKGFVTIEKSESDQRAVQIQISENRKSFIQDYYKRGTAYLSEMYKDFDESELQMLWNLLKIFAAFGDSNWVGYEERVPLY